ncbi:MAG: N-methyl-L-tryptophan oxidase [Rubrobacter sp.]
MVYDAIVLGLGGMGSAAAYHLARRGNRVLGLEKFGAAHDRGASHGKSRIIRQAYFEGEAYVPLILRAYELWDELERESDEKLIHMTGALMLGSPDSGLVSGSVASAQKHGLPYELLGSREIRTRFPAFEPPPDTVALHEKRAGYVLPETSVKTHLDLAYRHGSDLHFQEPALDWEATSSSSVVVRTQRGVYEAGSLIITAGAWSREFLAGLGLPLRVERRVMHWFEPHVSASEVGLGEPGRFPVFVWEPEEGEVFYGIPDSDSAVKAAFHYVGEECSPDTLDREVGAEEISAVRDTLKRYMPRVAGRHVTSKACTYTNTPDLDFVVSVHPEHPQVSLACGFSGHGYKFCPVMGEVLADLATTGETPHPVGMFSPARFTGRSDQRD